MLKAIRLLAFVWISAYSLAQEDVRRDAAVIAVEKVMPSVVNIATETIVYTRHPLEDLIREFYDPFYRRRTPNTLYSLGSGVIIDEDGYIVTNEHVVRSATRIAVKLPDGREYECDRVVSSALSDVALLKIRCKPKEKFVAAKFAEEGDLLLGETVLALGNPFGLGGSVTRGILSSKNRRPPRENEPLDVADWLQTDAAINPGNSGGPLINLKGEVIGINVAVYREGQGIGFAIPIKIVNEAISEVFTPENLKSMWFGAKIKIITNRITVISIEPESPSEKAGLMPDDVLLAINGKFVNSIIGFVKELVNSADNESVLQLKREGMSKTVKIRLIPEKSFFNEEIIKKKLGIGLQVLDEESSARIGLKNAVGFLITEVEEGSPAEKAGFSRGLIINAVDDKYLNDMVSLARLIHLKKKGQSVVLNVLAQRRQGMFIEMRTFNVELICR